MVSSTSFQPDGEGHAVSVDSLLYPSRARQGIFGTEDDQGTIAALREYQAEPVDDSSFITKKRHERLEEIWRKWLDFASLVAIDPEETWIDVCLGVEKSKPFCQTFLKRYVQTSVVHRPCLGPEEWRPVRTITCAVTVEDVWADLVKAADMKVIRPRQLKERDKAHLWSLNYSSRNKSSRNATVCTIARWIPLLASELGLSLKQTFNKQEATPEDVVLAIDTLWTRAPDIPCTPDARVAFHAALLLAGIGGWRPESLMNVTYGDVKLSLVRDPRNATRVWPIATITIHHVKQRTNRIERDQRSRLSFSVSPVPSRHLCLLSLLVARAIADNAFAGGYTSSEQVLRSDWVLDQGIDWSPLAWKSSMSSEKIIPIAYHKYWTLWHRTLFVAGLRETLRPYALRVGAGGRLDGTLTPAMRNYILSNSTQVYEQSYHPVEVKANLMNLSFGALGGQADDELVSMLRRGTLKRDPGAPLYVQREVLDGFETRKDISGLRRSYRETGDPVERRKITSRIQYIINSLESLAIEEMRQKYFNEVDALRAKGQSTAHLSNIGSVNPRAKLYAQSSEAARTISGLMGDTNLNSQFSNEVVAYLRGQSAGKVEIEQTPVEGPRCLLCSHDCFSNKQALSRHVWHGHSQLFKQPFRCPECHRLDKGDIWVKTGRYAWSSHVARFHKSIHAPNPASAKNAYCPICTHVCTARGFGRHFNSHVNSGQFSRPFHCPECSRQGLDAKTLIKNMDTWIIHVRDAHNGPWDIHGAVRVDTTVEDEEICSPALPQSARKRKRDTLEDMWAPETPRKDAEDWSLDVGGDRLSGEFWVTGRDADYE